MRDPSTRDLDAWSANIHIAAADDEQLLWLDEFFPPSFWCVRPEQTRFATVLARLPERLTVPASGVQTTVFSLDHAFESHSLVARRETACDYYDAQRGALYRFESRARQIQFIPFEHAHSIHMPLVRAVRELVSLRALNADEVLIHGAAFDVGGRGVVLAGPKHAGKTSLLLFALRARGTSLVSSDRVFLRDGETPRATGIPTLFKVRHSAGIRFPRLTEPLLPPQSCAARELLVAGGTDAEGDVALSPATAAGRLGVPLHRETQIVTLAFIKQQVGAGGLALRVLGAHEAQHRLFSEGLFRTSTPMAAPQAFSQFARWRIPSEQELARACAGLVARVRVVECAVGADVLENASGAEATRFVHALVDASP